MSRTYRKHSPVEPKASRTSVRYRRLLERYNRTYPRLITPSMVMEVVGHAHMPMMVPAFIPVRMATATIGDALPPPVKQQLFELRALLR